MKRGYIQLYTGNGKGKTTAALGQALRAAGRGMKTLVIQFLKGQKYGELESAKRFSEYIKIEQMGRDTFVHISGPAAEDIALAEKGMERARQALQEDWDILVLDEVNVAIYFRLLRVAEVLELLDSKPEGLEIILTGRYAPPELIKRADLVTRMEQIKHYYSQGVQARDGIER